jgi:hypothetical protein
MTTRYRLHGLDDVGFVTREVATTDEVDAIIKKIESTGEEIHQIEVISTNQIYITDWKNGLRRKW